MAHGSLVLANMPGLAVVLDHRTVQVDDADILGGNRVGQADNQVPGQLAVQVGNPRWLG